MQLSLARRQCLAEFVGTAMLVAVVVGSGISAEQLSPDDSGLQLFENAAATAAGLVAIILALGSVSGAHLNPVVTVADRALGGITTSQLAAYLPAQFAGGAVGAVAGNLMFSEPAVAFASKARHGGGVWLAEAIATAGLLLVVFGVSRSGRSDAAPYAVGTYIGAAYFFTASTSFANPAVTTARSLTDTFTGIAPESVPGFVAFQLVGAAAVIVLIRLLFPTVRSEPTDVVVPHAHEAPTADRQRPRSPTDEFSRY